MVYQPTWTRQLLSGVHPHGHSFELETKHVTHGVFWCLFVPFLSFLATEELSVVIGYNLISDKMACDFHATSTIGEVADHLEAFPRLTVDVLGYLVNL